MAQKPHERKRKQILSKEELQQLDKDDLVERIIKLEGHNKQLKDILSKSNTESVELEKKARRSFDFSKCHYRRVLLRIMYFGWDYQGLVTQDFTTQTIEHHLFHALIKACLIENRETSNYHRCGRTDKGVSSFGQVISISLRSKHPLGLQHEQNSIDSEMQYCKILNRLLPDNIRAVAWMPIPEDRTEYSARFDCKKRTYKYFFPRSSLDISAMRCACALLVGSKDFRHLCKMDVGNGVVEFVREILRAEILPVEEEGEELGSKDFRHLCKMDVGNGVVEFVREILRAEILPVEEEGDELGSKDFRHLCKMDVGNGVVEFVREILRAEILPVEEEGDELGSKDFRHLCKMHVGNGVVEFVREILRAEILPVEEEGEEPTTMYYLLIEGNAFLWHQIRCIMGVLLLVGQGKEQPDVINQLLDVDKYPRKPQYNMALDVPLNLYHCTYELEQEKQWVYGKDELQHLIKHLQNEWTIQNIKTTMIKDSLQVLEAEYRKMCQNDANEKCDERIVAYADCLLQGVKPRVYTPLMKRQTCSSLEERIEHYKKKRKEVDISETG
ncbi:tRNA pseudouridine(38/39) synthase [Ostrinia nubilalis]|uniref:tRNA pseudouridine(38/39) synthase n=1 Tax=Ostrinia nubilalis TaxID=29057 RepID=UPI0030825700